MWLIYTILAGALFTASGLISRHVLKGQKDAWAFSFFFSALGALSTLPFLFIDFEYSTNFKLWLLLILVGFLIVFHNFLNFKASNYIEASIKGSLEKFRLIWIFIMGIVILGGEFSWIKFIGTMATFFAGIIVLNRFRKQKNSLVGIALTISATIVYSSVIILYDFLLEDFSSVVLTFFIFFIPAIINAIIIPNFFSRVHSLIQSDGKFVIINGIIGGIANLSIITAIKFGDSTKVIVIQEAFLILLLAGENLILKEKSNLFTKSIAVILAIIGAILVRTS